MLACAELREEELPVDSNRRAKNMLHTYMTKSTQQALQDKPAQLVPHVRPSHRSGEYPPLSFQVGFDRPYVVRDIKNSWRTWSGGRLSAMGRA